MIEPFSGNPHLNGRSTWKALITVIESQTGHELQPKNIQADTAYGGDENVAACQEGGMELISPVAAKSPGKKPAPPTGTVPPDGPDEKESLTNRRAAKNAWKNAAANNKPKPGRRNMPNGPAWKE